MGTGTDTGADADARLGASPDIVRPDDIPWIDYGPGNWVKPLRLSPTTGQYAMLAKTAAGSHEPRHRHLGTVNLFVISGHGSDWNGYTGPPGSWVYERDQAVHSEFMCTDETVWLILGQTPGGLEILDDDGNVLGTFEVSESIRSLPPEIRTIVERD